MAPRERIFLFHGSDSLASSRAVLRWEQLFQKKHGSDLFHKIHADEMDAISFANRLRDVLLAQGLFGETSMVVVKRPTSREKGNGGDYTTAIKELLAKGIPETVTVVIWEELELGDTHSLKKWFVEASLKGVASVKLHRLLPVPKLMPLVREELQEHGLKLTREADQRIASSLGSIEKTQRLAKQLKAQDVLKQDERSWWLHHLVEGLVVSAPVDGVITETLVDEVADARPDSVGIFEVSNAITSRSMQRAREYLRAWELQGEDEANYFRLFHLLRRDAKRGLTHSGYARYMLKLLAQVELVIKNGYLTPAVAADLLCLRLQHADAESQPPLVREKVLWKATLQRSGN